MADSAIGVVALFSDGPPSSDSSFQAPSEEYPTLTAASSAGAVAGNQAYESAANTLAGEAAYLDD